MSQHLCDQCCWCATRLRIERDGENLISKEESTIKLNLLLELLRLSPSLLKKGVVYRLCEECAELVSHGTGLEIQLQLTQSPITRTLILRQLDEARVVLKGRTLKKQSSTVQVAHESRQNFTLTLGMLLSKCFSPCVVQLLAEDQLKVDDSQSKNAAEQFNSVTSNDPKLCQSTVDAFDKLEIKKEIMCKLEYGSVVFNQAIPSNTDIGNLTFTMEEGPKSCDQETKFDAALDCRGANLIDLNPLSVVCFQSKNSHVEHVTSAISATKSSYKFVTVSEVISNVSVESVAPVQLQGQVQAKRKLPTRRNVNTIGQLYECKTCNKKFKHDSSLWRHRRVHTSEKRFNCDICGGIFYTNSSLESHLLTHRKDHIMSKISNGIPIPASVSLEERNIIMPLESAVQQTGTIGTVLSAMGNDHQQESAKETNSLNKSPENEQREHEFSKSMNWKPSKEPEAVYRYVVAPTCLEYSQHGKKNAGPNTKSLVSTNAQLPFECDFCKKRFRKRAYMVCHRRIHTDEKPFECEICEERFNQPNNLARHKRKHTGEKPYGCSLCDKTFTQRSNLTLHLTRHSYLSTTLPHD